MALRRTPTAELWSITCHMGSLKCYPPSNIDECTPS